MQIEFKSDCRVGSGFGLAGLIDHIAVKSRNGVPYVPGSTLKGRLRMICKQAVLAMADSPRPESEKNIYFSTRGIICQSAAEKEICKDPDVQKCCVMCRLFGSEMHGGSLIFADAFPDNIDELEAVYIFNQDQTYLPLSWRTNVKLSRQSRVSEPKMLTTSEVVPNIKLFTARIYRTNYVEPWPTIESDLALLSFGASCITHLGAGKGRGLGRCILTLTSEDPNASHTG